MSLSSAKNLSKSTQPTNRFHNSYTHNHAHSLYLFENRQPQLSVWTHQNRNYLMEGRHPKLLLKLFEYERKCKQTRQDQKIFTAVNDMNTWKKTWWPIRLKTVPKVFFIGKQAVFICLKISKLLVAQIDTECWWPLKHILLLLYTIEGDRIA